MHVEPYHKKSPLKSEAEDAYAIHPEAGIYAVMDGVTPLHSYRDPEGHNGAYIAANLFKRSFEASPGDVSLETVITNTNRQLADLMAQAGADLSVMHERWSTCVAAVHIDKATVRYAQLGDSLIIAVYSDGRMELLTENRCAGVTQRAKLAREKARLAGKELPDESYYEIPLHRNQSNRWMANLPDGYGVANGMESIGVHMQTGELPIEGLRHLWLFSDGMFHPDMEAVHACARFLQMGAAAYVEEIETAELRKQALPDDRTSILLTF